MVFGLHGLDRIQHLGSSSLRRTLRNKGSPRRGHQDCELIGKWDITDGTGSISPGKQKSGEKQT